MQNKLTGHFSLGNTKKSRKIFRSMYLASKLILIIHHSPISENQVFISTYYCSAQLFHTDSFPWIQEQGLLNNHSCWTITLECLSNCRQTYKGNTREWSLLVVHSSGTTVSLFFSEGEGYLLTDADQFGSFQFLIKPIWLFSVLNQTRLIFSFIP